MKAELQKHAAAHEVWVAKYPALQALVGELRTDYAQSRVDRTVNDVPPAHIRGMSRPLEPDVAFPFQA